MNGESAAPLAPFEAIGAGDITLTLEAVSDDAVATGDPCTGVHELGRVAGAEIGMWEMTPGVMFDVEVDEFFVVVSGRATVTLLDDPEARTITLHAGSVCRLSAGMRTRWDVAEALRKVYIAAAQPADPT